MPLLEIFENRRKRWGHFCIDDVVLGTNFLWQAFVVLWGGGRQTDRLSKLKTGQILELSRSWGVGVFYKFPKFFVGALWQCCVLCAVCCVLCCCAAAAGCAAGGVGGKVKVGGWSASLLPAFTAINLIIVIIVVTALLQYLDLVPREPNRIDTFKLRLGCIAKPPSSVI